MKDDNGAELAAELAALWGDEYLATRTPEDLSSTFKIGKRLAEKILREERKKRSIE